MASNTPCLPGLFLGDTNTFGYHDDVGEAAFITEVYQKNKIELIVTDQKNHSDQTVLQCVFVTVVYISFRSWMKSKKSSCGNCYLCRRIWHLLQLIRILN